MRLPFQIEAQSPDTFLTHLFSLSPKQMEQVIGRQASKYCNPPATVSRLLDTLAKQVPTFVALMREALAREDAPPSSP